jgi:hypothetical protein
MKQVIRIDNDGHFLERVILQENEKLPVNCVEKLPPDGLFLAKWENGDWVENMPVAEIEAKKNTPAQPSEMDLLKKQQADLVFTLMQNGVI